jgi:hypothetical protein
MPDGRFRLDHPLGGLTAASSIAISDPVAWLPFVHHVVAVQPLRWSLALLA